MEFENIEYLWLLVLIIPILILFKEKENSLLNYFDKDILKNLYKSEDGISKRVRILLFSLAFILSVISLSRPYIDNGKIKITNSDIDIIVGFDISNSMFCDDVYPSRFEFAKRKFDLFLDDLKDAKVGVIGFSSKAFLISPLTRDFNSLRFLVKNMKFDYMSLKGTSIKSALEVTNDLLKESKKKALLLFSDGGDKKDYQEEIEYAKKHNILVYIYSIATKKGGVIKSNNGVLKDKNSNIVIVKENPNIKELAINSNGAYMHYSLSKDDISYLVKDIESKFKSNSKKNRTIIDKKELFYYPLLLAILLFILSFSSFPTKERR